MYKKYENEEYQSSHKSYKQNNTRVPPRKNATQKDELNRIRSNYLTKNLVSKSLTKIRTNLSSQLTPKPK